MIRPIHSFFGAIALVCSLFLAAEAGAEQAYLPYENEIVVTDTATLKEVTRIDVGARARGIAFSPDGRRAYVSLNSLNRVSVIDTATYQVVETYATPAGPVGLTVTSDSRYLYVAGNSANVVRIIDTRDKTFTDLNSCVSPFLFRMSKDGQKAYVVCRTSDELSVIDTASRTLLTPIPVTTSGIVVGADISPDGSRLYTSHFFGVHLSVVDTATGQKITHKPVTTDYFDILISPDGQYAYLNAAKSGFVDVMRLSDLEVVNTLSVSGESMGMSLSPDGHFLYLMGNSGQTTTVFDTRTGQTVGTLPSLIQERFVGSFITPPPAAAAVPTLGQWGMILMGLMLAGGAGLVISRRRASQA